MTSYPALNMGALRELYRSGQARPSDIVAALYDRIRQAPLQPVWISLVPRETALARTRVLERDPLAAAWPLYGVPFAIKDNIDLAELPTTAGCPAYAYSPSRSATVVEALVDAGAIPIGKTNLDQFATGLVGTRSPFGACSSVFDPHYISGGSSSGSAVAVAGGLATFALGTDTAGSGRVPAAFNNLVGLKPTRGLLSNLGVVPACRTLDCVSVLAATANDALTVWQVSRSRGSPSPARAPRPGWVGRSGLACRPHHNLSFSGMSRPPGSTALPLPSSGAWAANKSRSTSLRFAPRLSFSILARGWLSALRPFAPFSTCIRTR